MKNIKRLVLALMLSTVLFSCENDSETHNTVTTQNIQQKDSDLLIYQGEGEHDGKYLDVSLFLPELATGTSYNFHTDNLYNFSFKDAQDVSHNVVLMFMDVENGSNDDLSEETGTFQPSITLDLESMTDVTNSIPFNANAETQFLVVHDSTMNVTNAVTNFFGTLEHISDPRKKGMSSIPKI
jgi:hypothetical protein